MALLFSEKPLVGELSEGSCGYVLEPAVRSAIEVLIAAGMVSTVEIVATEAAA